MIVEIAKSRDYNSGRFVLFDFMSRTCDFFPFVRGYYDY